MAAIVEKVDAGVTAFRWGDHVIGHLYNEIVHTGTFAELVAGPTSAFVRKPTGMSWEAAGAFPLCGLTAYQARTRSLHTMPQETIYIHGASGALDPSLYSLTAEDVRVIGSALRSNHGYLRSLGVEPVTHQNFEEDVRAVLPAGVYLILQCSGKMSAKNIVHAGTRMAPIASSGDEFTPIYTRPSQEDLVAFTSLAEVSALNVRMGTTFPLHQPLDAEGPLTIGAANGKIVLVP